MKKILMLLALALTALACIPEDSDPFAGGVHEASVKIPELSTELLVRYPEVVSNTSLGIALEIEMLEGDRPVYVSTHVEVREGRSWLEGVGLDSLTVEPGEVARVENNWGSWDMMGSVSAELVFYDESDVGYCGPGCRDLTQAEPLRIKTDAESGIAGWSFECFVDGGVPPHWCRVRVPITDGDVSADT